RGRLSRGIHSVDIATAAGTARVDVNLAGRHALVAVRAIGGRTFVTPAGSPGVPAATPPDGSKSVRRSDGLVVSVLQFDSLTPVLGRTEQ
ncbi:MAG: hypothetical protein KIT73_11450, partial [Burkholderiales bacterium]|nr:hypothetical protein [Burkholderiales bacterium]